MKNLTGLMLVIAAAIVASAGETAKPPRAVSGVVTAIERVQVPNGVGRVRVTVRVKDKGAGESVVSFDEWETLWRQGDRCRVGQAVDLEVYPDSELGLSSGREEPADSGQASAKKDGECGAEKAEHCPAHRTPENDRQARPRRGICEPSPGGRCRPAQVERR